MVLNDFDDENRDENERKGRGQAVDKGDEATGSPSVRGPGTVVPMAPVRPSTTKMP